MILQTQSVGIEPVTLSEAKEYLRIDGSGLNGEVAHAISAARSEAERWTGRSFAPQGWMLIRDTWWLDMLQLPYGPVSAIESIEYLDEDGEWQTLPTAAYSLDSSGLLFRKPGYKFPKLLGRDHAVRIKYLAGTWSPSVPPEVERAILMLAQASFDSLSEQPETLRERAFSLLRPYRFNSGLRAA